MKNMVLPIFAAVIQVSCEDYKGWKSYYVQPSSSKEVQDVVKMIEAFAVDFLMMPTVDTEGLAIVKPKYQQFFTKALDELHISYKIHSDNIKETLDSDRKKMYKMEKLNFDAHAGIRLPYDNYQQLEVIDEYLINVADKYPEQVTLVQPGRSFESRPIYYLKISTSNFDGSKPVIIIDGGIHAREWISPPTVTWAIHKLVEDVTEPELLKNFDWILLPMVNPDGYKYSFSDNRFWRKNRSTSTHYERKNCPGVDINRNFEYAWMFSGASSNPCSETYAGDKAFSEFESQILRDVLYKYRRNITLYLSMHSYGSYIIYPYAHNGTLPYNIFSLHAVGLAVAHAINSVTEFRFYNVGNIGDLLKYKASGASSDYAHSIGIPFTFAMELPGFFSGTDGFITDPKFIEPIVQEAWKGIVAGARMIMMKNFKFSAAMKTNN